MDHDNHPVFSNIQEEANFWKNLAEKYYEEKQEIQREFDDFVEDSKQLEKELETSLNQAEKKIKEVQLLYNKTQSEIESLRSKLEQNQCENSKLQSEVQTIENERTQLTKYIRELEQKNDDLERAKRVKAESAAAVEFSLNMEIERNAILESEVDEKETLKEQLQRLEDEIRDLKQELIVKERGPDNERAIITNGIYTPLNNSIQSIDSNRLRSEMTPISIPSQVAPSLPPLEHNNDGIIRQPARVVALNLVNEILRKIGKLETKIAAHRANERNILNHHQSDINRNPRRLNRGTSSPSTRLSSFGN